MTGQLTWNEINGQAEAWKIALERARPLSLGDDEAGELLFLGSGIALYAGEALASLAEAITRRSARALPAQDLFAGNRLSPTPRTSVLLSRTGDVSDSIRAIEASRKSRLLGKLIAVVGESGGQVGALADESLVLDIVEQSVTTTKTLSSMILAVEAGLLAGAGDDRAFEGLKSFPKAVAEALPTWSESARSAAKRDLKRVVFLGTGPRYGLAKTAALSVCEMAQMDASGFHSLVFPHGHKVLLDEQSLAVVFLSDDLRNDELEVIAHARESGAGTIVVGAEVNSANADRLVELPGGIDASTALPLYLVYAQLLGFHMAQYRGLDPDQPRGLPKVF